MAKGGEDAAIAVPEIVEAGSASETSALHKDRPRQETASAASASEISRAQEQKRPEIGHVAQFSLKSHAQSTPNAAKTIDASGSSANRSNALSAAPDIESPIEWGATTLGIDLREATPTVARHTLAELKNDPCWQTVKTLDAILLRELCQQLSLNINAADSACCISINRTSGKGGFQRLVKALGITGVDPDQSDLSFEHFQRWYDGLDKDDRKAKKLFSSQDESSKCCFVRYAYSQMWKVLVWTVWLDFLAEAVLWVFVRCQGQERSFMCSQWCVLAPP
eukprot:SAG31_NODE_25_length_33055_cov_11.407919_19_plen_279_part_00